MNPFNVANKYLEDCIGTIHLELIIVPAEVFHQIFHYPLSLNSSPATFLQGHNIYCSKHPLFQINYMFHEQVFVMLTYSEQVLHIHSPLRQTPAGSPLQE